MLSDSIESARDSRAKSYTLGFDESAADSMKSGGASSGSASASDSFASESASFPWLPKYLRQRLMHLIPSMQVPSQGGTFFLFECILCLLLPILAMYDDQNQ